MPESPNWLSYHNHTSFSLLDGCGRIEDFVQRAVDCGFKSIAITDHGTCAGYIDFQILCESKGIKPIFGIEAYVAPESMTTKGLTDEDKIALGEDYKDELKKRQKNYHLILLAKNDVGLKNIYNINTDSNIIGFYSRPRIDYDYLKKHCEGLVCTTACMASKLNSYILNNDEAAIKREIETLKGMFGDDLYLELNVNVMDQQYIINKRLLELSKEYNIKYVFSTDTHYPDKSFEKAHGIILKINSNSKWEFSAKDLYIMSYDEIFEYIVANHAYLTEDQIKIGLANSLEIEKKCNVKLDLKSRKYPYYECPSGYTSKQYILKLIADGMKKRFSTVNKSRMNEYLDRVKFELEIIANMGYIDYFLIVQDFINWAKDNQILVGPGRGSVGGSLIAWLIGITEVDPIEYNLSFIRFLNPERLKAPDADTDIEDERRADVRSYLAKKWGDACIAPIIAYSRYSANSLFRDVCKQFDLSFSDYNAVAKTIDSVGDEYHELKSFKEVLVENPVLKKFVDANENGEEIADIISKLEGQIKNTSIAAAGTIISNKPLKNIMPLRRTKGDVIITEWEGHKLDPAGYLKMDLLGLKTLTVIKKCLDIIGKDINFIYNLPLNDDKVYNNFRKGKTEAIFQLESKNITSLLCKIKPTELEHISVTSSLYRPGPIETGVIEHYLKRKSGLEEIEYMHPLFESVLKPTLGLVIYQEQVIEIYNKLGLTFGEADLLRRYCEQKKSEKMQFYYDKIKAANILPKDEFEKLMPMIEERIGYSFNRSHSIQYSIVSYWGMWLKTYYPEIFCAVNLNQNLDKEEKINRYIKMAERECEIEVDYGDINNLSIHFDIVNKNDKKVLKFGYACVKSVSEESLRNIINFTKSNPVDSLKAFLETIKEHKAKKNVIDIFIKIGLFDKLDVFPGVKLNRNQLIKFYEKYLEYISMTKKALKADEFFKGDISKIFTDDFLKFSNILKIELNPLQLMKMEAEFIGHSPLLDSSLNSMYIKNKVVIQRAKMMYGAGCRVGYVAEITEKLDKKKKKMCFFKLVEEDESQVKCTVFSTLYEKTKIEKFCLYVVLGDYSLEWNSFTVKSMVKL